MRKQAEASLRNSEKELRALARSLLTAQEDECRRIARDLHDDVTQRLALLSIETGKFVVRDNGAGFPAQADPAKSGLGLISMKERIRMANGRLSITSQPGRGTEIVASVPLSGADA